MGFASPSDQCTILRSFLPLPYTVIDADISVSYLHVIVKITIFALHSDELSTFSEKYSMENLEIHDFPNLINIYGVEIQIEFQYFCTHIFTTVSLISVESMCTNKIEDETVLKHHTSLTRKLFSCHVQQKHLLKKWAEPRKHFLYRRTMAWL